MKKLLTASLVALSLIGTVSAASAIEVPSKDASLSEKLNFWKQFSDND